MIGQLNPDDVKLIIGSIVTGSVTILAVCIREYVKLLILSIYNKTKKKYNRWLNKHTFGKRDLYREDKLNEIIIENRIKADADRSHIFLFHNGETFSSNIPQFKLSSTHESLKDGVTSINRDTQNIRVSSVIDLIRCYWEGSDTIAKGVKKLDINKCACNNASECKYPNGVYKFDVDKMVSGCSKYHLSEKGVKHVLTSPILNERREVIGYTSLDFCRDVVDIERFAQDICEASSKISYYLTQKH